MAHPSPAPSPARRSRPALIAAVALVALLGAGCGIGGDDDDDTASDTTTTTAEATTTSSTTSTTEATTTTTEATTSTTEGAGGEPVPPEQYAEGVCTAMGDWQAEIERLAADLQANPPTEPQAGRDVLVTFVGNMAEATNTMVDEVSAAGPPDIDEGGDIHDTLTSGLDSLAGLFEDLQADIEEVPADDPVAFAQALTEVTTGFQESAAAVGEAFGDIDTQFPEQSQELRTAFQAEPACEGVIG